MTEPRGDDSGPPVPLLELDRCLAPIRRVVTWAARDVRKRVHASGHLESIGNVWLKRALGLELPEAIADGLGALGEQLDGLAGAEHEERCARMSALYQSLTRLDAVLGLPLRNRGPYRSFPKPKVASQEHPRSSQGPDRSRKSEGDVQKPETHEANQGAAPAGSKAWRGLLWQPLASLDIPQELLERLEVIGVITVLDLLWLRPKTYERIGRPVGAGIEFPEQPKVAIGGRVAASATTLSPTGERTFEVRLEGKSVVRTRWAAPPPVSEGQRVVIVGVPDGEDEPGLSDCELVIPSNTKDVYLASYGLECVEDVEVRGLVSSLDKGIREVRDSFPGSMRTEGAALRTALQEVHRSPGGEARERMALNEVFAYFLGQALRGGAPTGKRSGQPVPTQYSARLAREGPYLLSDEEQVLLEGVRRDLRRGVPMRRLLVGQENPRVWAICMHALVTVAETRAQVVVVSDSPKVVESMSLIHEGELKDLGLVSKCIVGPVSDSMLDALSKGDVHVVFGTPDVLEPHVSYRRLSLVVAREDCWRHSLAEGMEGRRGAPPNVLLHSFTPVSPEHRWTQYACYSTSVLGMNGPEVEATVAPEGEREEVFERVFETLQQGKQALIVFPRPQGGDALEPSEATRLASEWGETSFPGFQVGVFQGGGSKEERQAALDDFTHLRSRVLLVTGRLEELPWWPDLGAVVMEQAHRSSLRRLRHYRAMARTGGGRVWWMVPEDLNASDGERLTAWAAIQSDESGESPVEPSASLKKWRWFEPATDSGWMQVGSEAAQRLAQEDPKMRRPPNGEVALWVRTAWSCFEPEEDCPVPAPVEGEKRRRRRRRR